MSDSSPHRVRISLRTKLTILTLIIAILFAAVNTFNIFTHRRSRIAETVVSTATIARMALASVIVELGHSELDSARVKLVVRNFLESALVQNKKNKDFVYLVVINAEGKFVTGRAKPSLINFPGNKVIKDETKALLQIAELKGKLGQYMRVKRFPLKSNDGRALGTVIVGTSVERVEEEVRKELIFNFAVLAGFVLVLLFYASFSLGRLVVQPITQVTNAMREVQTGNLDREVDIHRNDEIGILADTYNFMVRGLKEQERLKDAFNRYVSSQVYEKFQAGEIQLTGESRHATILFADIRSFTTLSERLRPNQVVTLLNEYFTEMVEIVFKYDGFINKFIGDAIMAIYNVPVDQDRPELRAVRTALEMMYSLRRLNTNRQQRGLFPIKIGVGINTGPVVAGNIGHEKRLEYTVIGDAVNLAQRIESQTKVAGAPILISESTYAAVEQHIVAEALPPVKVKGKQEPVALYAVRGLRETVSPGRHFTSAPPVAVPDTDPT